MSPDRGSMTTPETESTVPNHSPVHDDDDDDSNIKIIKIEKTNEPLVSCNLFLAICFKNNVQLSEKF